MRLVQSDMTPRVENVSMVDHEERRLHLGLEEEL